MALLADNQFQLKYWVQTSQGLFGPYGTREQAVSASVVVPRQVNEVAQILERTTDGKEMLFG